MTAADQVALLEVQDLDTAIDRDRHRRANLPERAALTEIDRQALALRPALQEAIKQRDEVVARQQAVEAELDATEHRAAAVNRRLYGGEVSASRELQAMAADVESLKARASTLEDEVLEILDQRAPLDHRVTELTAQASELAVRRRDAEKALAQAERVVDAEIAELERKRSETAAPLPADLLATYDRLRARLGGVGAARLVGDHCDGCHLTLPATELDRIRHLPPSEWVTCDQCGRILIRA